jgi:hypothetical protein
VYRNGDTAVEVEWNVRGGRQLLKRDRGEAEGGRERLGVVEKRDVSQMDHVQVMGGQGLEVAKVRGH